MKKILLFLLLAVPLVSRADMLLSSATAEGDGTAWVIGDIVVTTLSDDSGKTLSQGFLQPGYIVPSGISDITVNDNRLKVYPNPVKEKVFVETDGPCSWSIYDTLGKFLAAGKLSGTPGEYIYVENLAPGYYILTVSSEKGTSSIQLVK